MTGRGVVVGLIRFLMLPQTATVYSPVSIPWLQNNRSNWITSFCL
jgi:hypothetical protein